MALVEARGVGGGVFLARYSLEFKFTAVWGPWDPSSRNGEVPLLIGS